MNMLRYLFLSIATLIGMSGQVAAEEEPVLLVAGGPISAAAAMIPPSKTSGFIVNNATVDLHTIAREDVVGIFMFQKRYWDSGNKVVVVLPPLGSISFNRLAVLELRVGAQFYNDMIQAKVQHGLAAPVFVTQESFIPIKVANTPYSIGYYHDTITINTGIGIRVLPLTVTPSSGAIP